jgi:hypothetical protein
VVAVFPQELWHSVTTRLVWLLKWSVLGSLVGGLVGLAVAGFLWSLDWVTRLFWQYPGLFYVLPGFGWLGAQLYERLGRQAAAGTNLIIDQIHEPGGGVHESDR